MDFLKPFLPKGDPLATQGAVVSGPGFRITVLTSKMLRLEYHAQGRFMDAQTQTVLHRAFPKVNYTVYEDENQLEIITSDLHLRYDKQPFSFEGLSVELKHPCSDWKNRWYYGDIPKTLMGTTRTLDEIDGATTLGEGLVSIGGFALIDDSGASFFDPHHFLKPGCDGGIDLYLLGYGHDYLGCLKDFYRLSGATPMLPRFALGNWWSRFHQYTDESYRALVERFKDSGIPLSVSVIDMDWHLTDIDPKYGSGWTGYTWNRDLFPDPKATISYLHENNLHVSLNVHPADGCRAHEEAYPEMAAFMGVNEGEKVDFDASDPKFIEAYFKYLHHPHEDIGVDFWWVDWQQKGGSRIRGLDPLFILNHTHYIDNARNGNAPLLLSRYAGLGSHRTPVGFSGDTHATWESLDFQPYFTATASNVGYGWWSHDIGGHMHGVKDDDLFIRWLQFGVFSPIMRLHSSNNPFMDKEPWALDVARFNIAKNFMRLRHKLIPYLHTMNARAHFEGVPLIEPMYYRHPDAHEAYTVPNEYYFGTQLIACPMTKPLDPILKISTFDAWLPQGTYYDIFSGLKYRGNRRLTLHRGLNDLPVLARAGGILPLTSEEALQNGAELPRALDILLFCGADGSFTLYEGSQTQAALTEMTLSYGKELVFTMKPVTGDGHIVPSHRRITLKLYGISDIGTVNVQGAKYLGMTHEGHITTLCFDEVSAMDGMTVQVKNSGILAKNDTIQAVFTFLNAAWIPYDEKRELMALVKASEDATVLLGTLMARHTDPALLRALTEIITA